MALIRLIFLFISFYQLFNPITAKAQYEVLPFGDVVRTPLKEKKYTDVEGTPYLIDKWTKGKVLLKNGKRYQYDSLKYDLLEDKLIFIDNGNMMHFADPVIEFELVNPKDRSIDVFKNGLPVAEGITSSAYLQMISKGKISLYKKVKKSIQESKQYGSASLVKSFVTTYSYYSLKNEYFSKIIPNKRTIITLFGIEEEQLNSYLKNQKVDFKNDEDLNKLFNHLNSIKN